MQYTLPKDPTGASIVIKLVGGLGDCIIALASTARTLKSGHPCLITLAVRDYQVEYFKHFEGVDFVISAKTLNNDREREKYDVLLDLDNVFVSGRQFKDADYYSLIEDSLDIKLELAKLKLPSLTKTNTISIHSGASNPNRAWPAEKWEELGQSLLSRGFNLCWLGTVDEPHINGYLEIDGSIVTSKKIENKDLYFQSTLLAESSYFIGNDSGFCHVAGILGLEGSVIFSATDPNNVIKRYEKLKPVVPNDFKPTSSINSDDKKSLDYLKAITPDQMLKVSGFDRYPILSTSSYNKIPLEKKILVVKGDKPYRDSLISTLSRGYKILPDLSSSVAEIDLDNLTVRINNKIVRVLNNEEAFIRTIKDLLN